MTKSSIHFEKGLTLNEKGLGLLDEIYYRVVKEGLSQEEYKNIVSNVYGLDGKLLDRFFNTNCVD